jgi:hypothetical protein
MKKSAILASSFVLALAASALAQEKPLTTNKDMTQTVKVTVTGALVLDYVWRSSEVTFATASIAPGAGSDSENTFEGYFAARLNIDLSDKVAAVVEFGTRRVDAGAIDEWGSGVSEDIVLREAHVLLTDFLTQGLKAQIGIGTWTFDVRGRGNSFAFDLRHSASITKNISPFEDVTATLGTRTGAPDELDPVGVVLTYSRDALTLDFVLLPAVIEGGNPSADEGLAAVDFWYNLDSVGKGSRVGAILALMSFGDVGAGVGSLSGSHSAVFTLGGGVDLKLMNGQLEVYGEIYLQFGDAGKIRGAATDSDLDAGGMAFNAGAVYSFGGEMNPWVGASLTLISGDGDTVGGTDDTVDNFLAYDNVSDLIIIEDMYFGFDWDTNYFAIKFSGGLSLSVGAKNNFGLEAILGITRTNEDVQFATSSEDALGTEFDVKAKWHVSKQATLQAAVGLLFGSDVLEEGMGGSANSDSDDSAMLYTIGADLRF